MAFQTVLYEKLDKVAKITLNRPEVRNAESQTMSREWQEAFKMAEADPEVRVIVLAGAGPDFSSGHDMGTPQARAEMEENPPQPGLQWPMDMEWGRWLNGAMYVRDIWKPTIAQVQGHCIMGGLILATMCDLIIASEDATFQDMGVRFGVPAVEYFSHPWDMGTRKAKEFLFTGDPITAQEAMQIGMVNRVVAREKLEEETMNLAKRIALGHPFALRVVKMACNATQDIQGFKQSMLPQFLLHQMGHAHAREVPDYMPARAPREKGGSVKDLIRSRDRAYENK
ncbi:enoyl-CoA hydratase [Thermodesulfobacteriota bacterium]